jgi:flagellin
MRAQIRGLDMASKNTQDGISLVQTAEGGLQEIDNMIQRIRELVVQAANETNDFTTADRKKLQDEIDQLTQGIDQMANQVEFNAKKLLDGSLTDASTKGALVADINIRMQFLSGQTFTQFSAVSQLASVIAAGTNGQLGQLLTNAIQATFATQIVYTAVVAQNSVGGNVTMSFTVNASGITVGASNVVVAALGTSHFRSSDVVRDYIGAIDAYIGRLQDAKKNGAAGVDDILKALNIQKESALQIYSGLELLSSMTRSVDALNSVNGNTLWFQTGSNSVQGMNVGIGKVTSDVLGIGLGRGVSTIKVDKANSYEVSAQIDVVNSALMIVTGERAKLGAVQNRLEFTKNSLDISSENLSSAESRIRDADMGKEMMKLTAANILQQAGISMLAQANQSPQSVLQLLR